MSERVIYTLRPDNTPLWLPLAILEELGLQRGARLTSEQFADARVQTLLAHRRAWKKGEEVR
jgi:hypothetical protein